jgi:hypothetical protein
MSKNEQQTCFSLPNFYQAILEELKVLGFTNASFVRDAVAYQLEQEAKLDAALKDHSFSTYYLEVI